ncbi:vitellogenin-like [Megalops cyprinoides]|uniref:vitellogenin-like n=1 Tax=Megalops cyprinoides TaxID=118141 RepID=UPI001863A61F|nr:vitellogenin-like [Megalops cyprinoides]
MRGIILAVTLAVVGCQQIKYEPIFPGKKTYQYKYEGSLMNGVSENDLVRAGMKIISDVAITEIAQNTYVLQMVNPLIQEYNGVWPNAPFISMAKLVQALKQQLVQPVKFEYNGGHVGQIFTPAGLSNTVVNIHRGILSMLQVTVKTTQTVYQLQEPDIAGTCHTSYVLQQESGSDQIIITKSKDLTNCDEKVQKFTGMAYIQKPTMHNEVAKTSLGTAAYMYVLKPLKNSPGLLIAEVTSKGVYQFSPLNDEGEASLSEASQKLILAEVKEAHGSFPDLEFQKRGTIQYQFASEFHQAPTFFLRIENVEAEVINALQQLVLKNVERVHKDAPNEFLKLVQLLQTCTYENINGVWKQYAKSPQYRSWLLDALPAVGNSVSFRFIAEMIIKAQLTVTEAGQVLVTAMHLVQADLDTLKIAAELLSAKNNINSPTVYNLALLAYGSMANRFCVVNKDCPDIILKPLHDFAAVALDTAQEEDTILALKAIGNAGNPASIKTIMKILSGHSSIAPEFLAKVQVDAIMALRKIAQQDPTHVQEITLGIFMDQSQQPEVRMLASVVLLEAKPPLALLTTVAEALTHETSLHVTSFVYSLMKSLSRSTTPGHEKLSAACDAAVKLLSLKLDQLSYRYSKSIYVNLYKGDLMLGAAVNIHLMKSSASIIPRFSIFKVQTYILGKTAEPLEFGIRAEGIEDVLMKNSGESHTISTSGNIQRILQLVVRGPVSNYSIIWKVVAMLQEGKTLQFSNRFLAAQLRAIIPTCIGLPVEISLFSTAVISASVTAQTKIMPTPTGESSLAQLLSSDVHLSTDGSMGMAVSTIATMGINTEFIQAGKELHLMVHAIVPVKFTTKADIKEKNLKVQFDPCIRKTDLLTMRTEAFAITRNIEDRQADKKIQLQPEAPKNILKSHFKPESLPSEEKDSAASVILSDEIMSTKTEMPTEEKKPHVLVDQEDMCAEAPNFGFKQLKNNARQLRTSFSSSSSTSLSNSESSKSSLKQMNLRDTFPPLFAIVSHAKRIDGSLQGYELAVYVDTTISKPQVQLLAMEMGNTEKGHLCVNADLQSEYKALMTIYTLAVPVPIAMPTGDMQSPSGLTPSLSKTLTKLTELSKSNCIAEGGRFMTFDGVQYLYDMPHGCFHVLAQDCFYGPRFIILIKQLSMSDHLQVVKAHINENEIEILPSVSGKLTLIYNRHEILSSNLPFINTQDEVVIKAENQGLVLHAERYGLDVVYFDGKRTEVRISSIMRGKMCGLCGRNDGETKLEFRMPDANVASSAATFAHSWMLRHNSCREGCKLQQDHVGLNRTVSIMGELSRCYSIEPVLSCAPGCAPTRTALLNVSFHCLPEENPVKMDKYASLVGKRVHLVDPVVMHTACSCPARHCTD